MEETGQGGKPRHFTPQRNIPAPLRECQGVPRPERINNHLQRVLGLPQGLLLVGRARKTANSFRCEEAPERSCSSPYL